uniref:Uncharacterized protein n=1 Tax=Anguilla anguilla TaxID=7936 RepID=A0A0E9PEU5_ANGAN
MFIQSLKIKKRNSLIHGN